MKTTIWRPVPTWMRTLRVIATAGAVAATLLLGTVAAAATTPTGTQDQTDQGTAQERTLARHRALGALDTLAAQPAAGEPERTLARHRALGALDTLAAPAAIAAQPAARTDPAVPSPGVDVLATLLVGLVGGLIGGAAAVVGWTAMTRRRRPPAAGTLTVIAAAGVVAATLLLGAAPPAAAATSDSPACTGCAALFDTLRADVAAYVPTTQQPVFLTNIDQASLAAGVDVFPPDPIQPDIVAASVILDRLTADTSDLQAAGQITDDGLSAITTDINRLEAEFFIPIDPC
jgi:hypothetical protein